MVAIVVIKNRELGLMGTDLGAGRLLYGYIIQDTNRGWGVRTLTPTLPLTLTFTFILVTFLTLTISYRALIRGLITLTLTLAI